MSTVDTEVARPRAANDEKTKNQVGFTVAMLAEELQLRPAQLRTLKITDVVHGGKRAVRVPFADPFGPHQYVRIWTTGDHAEWEPGNDPNITAHGREFLEWARSSGGCQLIDRIHRDGPVVSTDSGADLPIDI
jgi:hypothetical protein